MMMSKFNPENRLRESMFSIFFFKHKDEQTAMKYEHRLKNKLHTSAFFA